MLRRNRSENNLKIVKLVIESDGKREDGWDAAENTHSGSPVNRLLLGAALSVALRLCLSRSRPSTLLFHFPGRVFLFFFIFALLFFSFLCSALGENVEKQIESVFWSALVLCGWLAGIGNGIGIFLLPVLHVASDDDCD